MEKNLFLQFKSHLKPTTLKSYANLYDRLRKHFDSDLEDQSCEDLIRIIEEIDDKTTTQLNLLNVVIIIKQLFNKNLDKLIEKRELITQKQNETRKITNKTLTHILPTIKELNDFLDILFQQKKWKEFIVNFLIINFNTRNADLFIDIVETMPLPEENTSNYLVLEKDRVLYIRNIYKTSKTYSKKEDYITDDRFIYAVKVEGMGALICNRFGVKIGLDVLGSYVKRYTYRQLGEIIIFKSIMKEASLSNISNLSSNRGSSVPTILQYYYTDGLS